MSNNNGRIDYESELKKISKFKYSKIDNFNKFEPDIIIDEKSIIFFDKKGTLLKFDKNSKLIWKKNYYSKGEKKIGPLINLASYNNYLIITDNLAKYYAVDINTGNLLWMKQNKAPFNSQVKIHKNKIYTVDYNNVLRSFIQLQSLYNFKLNIVLPKEILKIHQSEIKKHNSKNIIFTNLIREGIKNADCVMTDAWVSMGEKTTKKKYFKNYQVNSNLMKYASDQAIFMHCLPAHRGQEVSSELLDSNRSVVWHQAKNRMYVQQAIILALI